MSSFIKLLALLASLAAAFQCTTKKSVPDSFPGNVQVGTKIPDFSCQTSDGAFVTSESLAKKPSLIIFFQPRCADCVYQLGQVDAVWSSMSEEKKAGYNFLAISGGYPDEARKYWKEAGYTLPVSFQDDQTIYDLFSTKGFPSVYMADTGGEVRFTIFANNMQPAAFLIRDLATLE